MNKIVLACFLTFAFALSGDFLERDIRGPRPYIDKPRPHTNLWRHHTTKTIHRLETAIWILGLFCGIFAVTILGNFLTKWVYSRKRTKYQVKTNILQSDERTNLQRESYI